MKLQWNGHVTQNDYHVWFLFNNLKESEGNVAGKGCNSENDYR